MTALVAPESLLPVEQALALLRQEDDAEAVLELRDNAAAVAYYARKRGASMEAINAAMAVKLACDRRIGEMAATLPKAPPGRRSAEEGAPLSKTKILERAGINPREARRCEKIAAIPEEEFLEVIRHAQAKGEKLTAKAVLAPSEAKGYEKDEAYTPHELVEAARRCMGSIDCDPATCTAANLVVQAKRYYTKDDDGLSVASRWGGHVWLNPPYSAPLMGRFVEALEERYGVGHGMIKAACLLLNIDTSTELHQRLLRERVACLVDRRLSFGKPDGTVLVGNRFSQVVYYFGRDPDAFAREFAEWGVVVSRYRGAA